MGGLGSRLQTRPAAAALSLGIMAFTLAVQVFVWGSARPGGGALLVSWRAVFGIAYGSIALVVIVLACATKKAWRALRFVIVAAACVDALLWLARVAGSTLPVGAAASATAAAGAVAMVAAIHRSPKPERYQQGRQWQQREPQSGPQRQPRRRAPS
ncbi:MAG: hypothetical protein ACYDD4_13455 [Acidimicrobiales bacterium]